MPRTLLWQNVFRFTDYNGEEAETNIYLEAPPTWEGLSQFISQAGSVFNGISDAYNQEAIVKKYFPPTTPSVVKGLSSSYDRLLVLCREGDRVAGITIPAPSPLPYLQFGPFRGFKVDSQALAPGTGLSQLVALLAQTVTPAGEPWPVGSVVAALMVPQL